MEKLEVTYGKTILVPIPNKGRIVNFPRVYDSNIVKTDDHAKKTIDSSLGLY